MITRIVTALVALPAFLFLLYMGGIYSQLLFLALIIVGIYELYMMTNLNDNISLFLLCLFSLVLVFLKDWASTPEILSLFLLANLILYVKKFSDNIDSNQENLKKLLKSFFIYFYVAFPFTYILKIRALDEGFLYSFFMFLIIWSTDSMAYFSGRAFGRNKLSPLISPNKTIEGSIGGSLSALFIALLFNKEFALFTETPLVLFVLAVLLLTIISQIGDLFESTLKRLYNIKDSGKIFPGHGGVLDRFDSTLFTAPLYYIFIKFFIF